MYGSDDPTDIVSQLLIDDGVPSRGHRKNILNKDFKIVGVAFGPHTKFKNMTVQNFAGGMGPRPLAGYAKLHATSIRTPKPTYNGIPSPLTQSNPVLLSSFRDVTDRRASR